LRARPNSRLLIWLCLGIAGVLSVCSSSAFAARGHEFARAFSGPCVVEPCEGLLKEPSGVAVSEAGGDVYVVDKGANRVARFTAGGEYLSEFNGSGEVEVGGVKTEGKAAGSGGLEGEIPTGRFDEPEGIAVDNSCTQRELSEAECTEKDPSSGDVYVVDERGEQGVVDKYSPTGEYLGQITQAGAGGVKFQGEAIDGVAVDTQGRVWVYREEPVLDGFSAAEQNVFIEAIPLGGKGLGFPPRGSGVAVDSQGDFYLRARSVPVAKVSHSGEVLNEELDEEDASAVAVDQLSGEVFVDNIGHISVFTPEGVKGERFGEQKKEHEQHLIASVSVAVDAPTGFVFVADSATDEILGYGPVEPEPPEVESESIANVTSESADLGAEINPRSETGEAPSEYHFQYGACASASSCESSGYEAEVPVPDAKLPADFEAHAVGAHVQGLKPNTTYHFRALAHNARGQGQPGEERTFTTQGPGGELRLPDGRGYELVSPPDKQGALIEPIAEFGVVEAAASGDGITYLANAPTEAQPQGYTNEVQVLSRRGAAAWSTRDIAIPHSGATGLSAGAGVEYKFFNPELTLGAVQPFGEFIPALSAEASESTAYLHALGDPCDSPCYRPLVTGRAGVANVPGGTVFGEAEACIPSSTSSQKSQVACGPKFLGATEDLSHVVLFASAALTIGAGARQLYEWSGGVLSHVSVLPGGESPEAASLGLNSQATRGAISADGSRIAWESQAALYQRDVPRGETAQLDRAEGKCEEAGECESGGGRFQFASADGSRVFFSDTHRLSEDSGANAAGELKADLYECRMSIQAGKLHCTLHDLTPERGGEGAEVQGSVLGASEDGEYVYFVAKGVQSETPNGAGQSALAGQPNLYLRHGGATSFIATLSRGDVHDWSESLSSQPTRVSPDGHFLELMSEARLTGYDNRDVETGAPAAEVYLYDATGKRLSCASCEPSGARPVGVEYFKLEPGSGGLVGGPRGTWESSAPVAANVPGWTAVGPGQAQLQVRYQPRYLENSGRLFFNSADALVPQDSNGTQDVYQYEPPGVGDCKEESATFSARSGGCVSLISSGGSAQESAFMDASESGDDVFFLTAAKLSALDTDAALDIYDAHACTGSSPCISSASEGVPPCSTEASCKASPTPQPQIFGAPASATFSGPGNAPPPPLAKIETKAEKLTKALKACRTKKNKQKRVACERQARSKYGAKVAKKKKAPKKKAKPRGKKK
jgi:DNA-binding beta-propeller fold protein YncE